MQNLPPFTNQDRWPSKLQRLWFSGSELQLTINRWLWRVTQATKLPCSTRCILMGFARGGSNPPLFNCFFSSPRVSGCPRNKGITNIFGQLRTDEDKFE